MEVFSVAVKENRLQRLDGRVKLISTMALLIAIVSMREPYIPLTLFLINLSLLVYVGVPVRKLLYPFYISIVVFIVLAFTTRGKPIGVFTVTKEGLKLASLVMVKVLACTSVLLILIATTPIHEMITALCWIRLPKVVVDLTVLMMRYVDTLAEELQTLIHALKMKNAFSKFVSWRKKVYNMGIASGALIIKSIDRASRVYMAMTLRGYGGSDIIKPEGIELKDSLMILASVAFGIILILLDGVIS